MAFFEQLGKKLSDAGQGVAQQTKNLADVTRLNSAISDKEKAVSQLYLALGQAYYEGHRNDPSADERETIASINALFAEIAGCREEIKQIKGVVKCPNCGGDVPLSSAFCPSCGTKIVREDEAAPSAPDKRVCPACGAQVPAGNIFCTSCGTKLDGDNE